MQRGDLQQILDEAVSAAGAPGASLAVLENETIEAASVGYANAVGDVAATTETAFQVGSITKAFTATLAMQLVDEGLMSLDTTLPDLLPSLRTARPEWAARVQLRHLLAHTSGIDGDLLTDTGEADDYLRKFVEVCDGIDFVHEPGAFFSYCNVGYILLGRIIEIACGQTFDSVLKERLLVPLALESAQTIFELDDVRLARGHAKDGSSWTLVPPWPRSNTPSGSRLAMTPRDLVSFARFHLSVAEEGSAVLSQRSARAMRQHAIATPYSMRNRAWGLGWMHFDWGGETIFGHDGGVCGTVSFLRIVPDAKFAVALAVNGPDYAAVYRRVMQSTLGARLGIDAPPPQPASDPSIGYDYRILIGRYERHGLFAEILNTADGLAVKSGGEIGDPNEPVTELRPIAKDMFVTRLPGSSADTPLAFFDHDRAGKPRYLHYQDRAYRRRMA